MLDAGVKVLGILAHDHEVDIFEPRGDAGKALRRTDIRIQVQLAAQVNIDRAIALADLRFERTFERDARLPQRFEQLIRRRRAIALDACCARKLMLPVDFHAGRIDHGDRGADDLGTDAIAGNQRDGTRAIAGCLRTIRRNFEVFQSRHGLIVYQPDEDVACIGPCDAGDEKIADATKQIVGIVPRQGRFRIEAGRLCARDAIRKCERTGRIGGTIDTVGARDQRRDATIERRFAKARAPSRARSAGRGHLCRRLAP